MLSSYWEKKSAKNREKTETTSVKSTSCCDSAESTAEKGAPLQLTKMFTSLWDKKAQKDDKMTKTTTENVAASSTPNKPSEEKTASDSVSDVKTARTKSIMVPRSTKSSATASAQMVPGFGATGKGVVQAPAAVESKRVQNVKKFFFRIKERIGLVEKTEISKAFTDSLKYLDKYKLCLDALADAVCGTIQENPSYRKEDYKMEMAPPPNEEEHELVSKCLAESIGFDDYKNQKAQIESYMKLGNEQRDYIKKGRNSLNNVRTFIQREYWTIAMHRTELDKLRREMDFAKAELKAAKDAQLIALKNQMYQAAVKAFEDKLKLVTTLLDQIPRHKETHIADLQEWAKCTKSYHERMAQLLEECEKASTK